MYEKSTSMQLCPKANNRVSDFKDVQEGKGYQRKGCAFTHHTPPLDSPVPSVTRVHTKSFTKCRVFPHKANYDNHFLFQSENKRVL